MKLECEACAVGVEEARKRAKEAKEKYGFYIHHVFDVDPTDTHTHGLCDFGHPELQIRLNIDYETSKMILNILGDKIKNGAKFKHRQIVNDDDICTLPFTFINAGFNEDNKQVLRIILPDKNGAMPWDNNCDPEFEKQIIGD